MEKTFLLRKIIGLSLLAFFVAPSLHLLFYVDQFRMDWDPSLGVALWGSLIQAFLSSLFCLFGGALGAWGLLGARRSQKFSLPLLRLLLLLPGFLPPLLVMTLCFRGFPGIPHGLVGVVFFHTFMNMGLASLMIEQLILRRGLGWMTLSKIENISLPRFLFLGLIPNLRAEILYIFLFFFLLCVTSFSVPFLVGGAHYGGIEVFLYEVIFLYRDWGQALGLSIGLMLCFLGVSLLFEKPILESDMGSIKTSRPQWGNALTLGVGFVPIFILSWGFISSVFLSLSGPQSAFLNISLFRGSLLLGLGTGLGVFILASLILYCFFSPRFSKILFFAVPPGWMVVAFSFFLMGDAGPSLGFVKSILALSLLFLPFLFRLSLFDKVESLRDQVAICRLMGASWNHIFFKVLWPQGLPRIAFMAGLAGAWAVGDFAVSSVLLETGSTLALQMKDLLTGYHLRDAEALVLPLAFVLATVFLIFQGLGYVCRRQSL